jgi:TonB family protein
VRVILNFIGGGAHLSRRQVFLCLGESMNFYRQFLRIAIPVLFLCNSVTAQSGNGAKAENQDNHPGRDLPKTFACPPAASMGDVSLRIVVDTKGNVAEVKALDGPEKLIPSAEACAKTWKYDNAPAAPVTKNVLIRYDSRDCRAAESQRGELQYSWGLRDRNNLVLGFVDGEEPPPLPYPEEERKAGAVGRMLLSVSLNMDGTVKDVHVLQGLTPRLNEAVMGRLRPLKFKLLEGVSEVQLQQLVFQANFHATCPVQTVMDIE